MKASLIKTLWQKLTKNKSYTITEEHQKCLDILENTHQNLFITGKAGTGKSLLIQYFRTHTQKKVALLAPTGIAALNIRGQTIHSFFGFPPRLIELQAIRKSPRRIFADLDCLIIDEISMVRADLLDGIDRFLRLSGRDRQLPFGGVQVVFVGDLYQLPPVVTPEEAGLFYQLYESPYFFSAGSFQPQDFEIVELTNVFRQKDAEFISLLNQIRAGHSTAPLLDLVNQKIVTGRPGKQHIILCPVNQTADQINQERLVEISHPLHIYGAVIEGDFPTQNRSLPVELKLKLKKDAKVIFVKNDPAGRWVNGTTGKIQELGENLVRVKLDETKKIVEAGIEEWVNIRYEFNQTTGQLEEKVIGKLKQYPLRLAWAITIHRSQGMSLDKVCLDFSRSPFAHGQTYVALSRCRSLDGLALTRKIWPNDILIDPRIIEFHQNLR